jgi:hypothetical protein
MGWDQAVIASNAFVDEHGIPNTLTYFAISAFERAERLMQSISYSYYGQVFNQRQAEELEAASWRFLFIAVERADDR